MISSSGTIMARVMPPNTHRANSSPRCFLRTNGVSANLAGGGVFHGSLPANAFHDQVGGEIHQERNAEEQDADDEQHPVMVRAFGRLAQLGSDGGGERANGVE